MAIKSIPQSIITDIQDLANMDIKQNVQEADEKAGRIFQDCISNKKCEIKLNLTWGDRISLFFLTLFSFNITERIKSIAVNNLLLIPRLPVKQRPVEHQDQTDSSSRNAPPKKPYPSSDSHPPKDPQIPSTSLATKKTPPKAVTVSTLPQAAAVAKPPEDTIPAARNPIAEGKGAKMAGTSLAQQRAVVWAISSSSLQRRGATSRIEETVAPNMTEVERLFKVIYKGASPYWKKWFDGLDQTAIQDLITINVNDTSANLRLPNPQTQFGTPSIYRIHLTTTKKTFTQEEQQTLRFNLGALLFAKRKAILETQK